MPSTNYSFCLAIWLVPTSPTWRSTGLCPQNLTQGPTPGKHSAIVRDQMFCVHSKIHMLKLCSSLWYYLEVSPLGMNKVWGSHEGRAPIREVVSLYKEEKETSSFPYSLLCHEDTEIGCLSVSVEENSHQELNLPPPWFCTSLPPKPWNKPLGFKSPSLWYSVKAAQAKTATICWWPDEWKGERKKE